MTLTTEKNSFGGAAALTRRQCLAAPAIGILSSGPALAAAPSRLADFSHFLRSLAPLAKRAGVASAVFEEAVKGLAPDPALLKEASRQPEFETPIWIYLRTAAGPERTEQGRRAAAQWARPLSAIQQRSGVAGQIVLAAWGMEADFREPAQTRDVVRSLATLAYARPRSPQFKTEFVDALVMIQRGLAARRQLRGSWAGAMGMPQFMPSAYLKYALAFDGRGPADIWTSVPDSLASIANFFAKSGWTRGLPWGFEAAIPAGFAWRSLRADFATWKRLGLRRLDGAALPLEGEADLFAPAGAAGPAFLLTSNYWIIKLYNNSDSYALSLGVLSDRIAGGPGVRRPWPPGARLLSRSERIVLQQSLAALGFYRGLNDGKIGPATRAAVHAFQIRFGLAPADGFASARVLARAETEARNRR